MAKGVYIGVGGVARKVKKMYIGVGGVARKVKKAYIGVGGVARVFWSSEPTYGGTASALSTVRYALAGASTSNHAVFAGGNFSINTSPEIDTYDTSLTKGTATALSGYNREGLSGASFAGYAVFGGGGNYSSGYRYAYVDYYDSSLTKSTASDLTYGADEGAAAATSSHVVFGCGRYYDTSDSDNKHTSSHRSYTAYDTSMTRTSSTRLYLTFGSGRAWVGAASIGNYIIFAGGAYYEKGETTVNKADMSYLNASLTSTAGTSLSQARRDVTGVNFNDKYALFAGGAAGTTAYNIIDVYDASLTRTTPITLSVARSRVAATVLDDYAFFAGGSTGSSWEYGQDAATNTVDMFDSSLTRVDIGALPAARTEMGATTIGSYALFAGGIDGTSSSGSANVYYYQV